MASVVVVVDLLDYFRFVQGLTWDFVASSEEPPVVRFVEASTVLPTATASRGCKASGMLVSITTTFRIQGA